MEPIAGRIDAGETPHQTAHRESLEEAGLTLKALEEISHYYPSPGATSEFLYSYVGIADLSAAHATVAGLDEEGEDILSHVLSFDTFMKGIAQGHNSNGPLVLSAYWLAQNRTRLRAEAHSGAPREGAGA
jgi:ADP-ribose pyrophosphatase YjhB (NUDIX family)